MGSLRTINHPGYEQEEIDLSTYASTAGGTTSLVIGFAKQGQSGVAVSPTSKAAVKTYFGTPETEAERYFYYGCAEVFDKGGNLIAARIPYNNAAQNLTPAVKYNIEQFKSYHCKGYVPNGGFTVGKYDDSFFSESEESARAQKYFAFSTAEQVDTEFAPTTGSVTSGESTFMVVTSYTDRTDLSRTLEVAHTTSAMVKVVVAPAHVDKIKTPYDLTLTNKTLGYFSFEKVGNPVVTWTDETGVHEKGAVVIDDLYVFVEKTNKVIAPKVLGGQLSDGAVLSEVYNNETGLYEQIPTIATNRIVIKIFDSSKIKTTKDLNLVTFNANYFAYQKEFASESVYTETAREASDFLYVASKKQPVLALVTRRGATSPTIAVKSYFPSTATKAETLKCDSNEFTEVRLTDEGLRNLLSYYNVDNIKGLEKYLNNDVEEGTPPVTKESVAKHLLKNTVGDISEFQIINCKFTASSTETYTKLDAGFQSAPVSTDVTEFMDESQYGGIGTKLKIDPLNGNVFVEDNYPVVEDGILFGRDARILTKLKNGDASTVIEWSAKGDAYGRVYDDGSIRKNTKVVYELVSDFASIKAIATAGSQFYKWIRWEIPTVEYVTGKYQGRALMASVLGCETGDVPSQIENFENLITIRPCDAADDFGFIKLTDFQDYRDGAAKPAKNSIVIANITEHQFAADPINNDGAEILGIVPVLVSGFQALPAQSRIELPSGVTNSKIFNAVEQLVRGKSIEGVEDNVDIYRKEFAENCTAKPLGSSPYSKSGSTYSNDCIGYVPSINLNDSYKPQGEAMNQVTLVVCQLALSKVENNKIVMTILESFTGSLDSASTDNNGVSNYIDNIVNSEDGGSSYVRMFTNYTPDFGYSKEETDLYDKVHNEGSVDNTAILTIPASFGTEEWFTKNKNAMSLGFTAEQTKKYISYSTITATLESVFDFLSNVDETEIDLVVDCGLSSIANQIKRLGDAKPESVKFEYDVFFDKVNSIDAIAAWKSICAKYLTFCSTTRKDCMALIDAPRSLGVKYGTKLVREGGKATVDFDILPSFNYLAGLNSNYGAGYATWMSYVDDFSGKTVWLPPSIAAEGSMILTDYKYNYWEAPAGKKRGVVTAAADVAFNPNDRQQDSIYSKSWNYAIRNNTDGVLLWGQKTLTTTTSAFDRINVRRLFLRLERMTRKFLKEYLFELNNSRTRNQIVDGITPVYENVKTMGGLYDYRIYCSELNNTATVIDNNELRFAVGLKPAKVAEYIYASYVCLSTGMDFSEMEPVL